MSKLNQKQHPNFW